MNAYVYRWSLKPEEGLAVELRVTAPNVARARREVKRFLIDHDGDSWAVECVSRETSDSRTLVVPLRSDSLASH